MSTVVFLGDSITYGVRTPGPTATQIFSYLIGNQRGFSTIINAGIPGDTAAGGYARLATDVIAHSPKVCFVMYGTNDAGNFVGATAYAASMKSIIDDLKTAGIEPVILSPWFPRSSPVYLEYESYLNALEALVASEGVHYVDIFRECINCYFYMNSTTFNAMWVDWAHPDVSGHAYIASFFERPQFSAMGLA
jgi:lysophospholipase L1-like esterase